MGPPAGAEEQFGLTRGGFGIGPYLPRLGFAGDDAGRELDAHFERLTGVQAAVDHVGDLAPAFQT